MRITTRKARMICTDTFSHSEKQVINHSKKSRTPYLKKLKNLEKNLEKNHVCN